MLTTSRVGAMVALVLAQAPINAADYSKSLLRESNEARAEAGLEPHKLDKRLVQVARWQADWMSQHPKQMRHAFFAERLAKAGFKGVACENIAWAGDEDEAFELWIRSRGHRANLLSDTTVAGFARVGRNFVAVYGKE